MNEIPQSSLPVWRRYLAYLSVALMPLSIDIQKVGDKEPSYRSPLDFLLPILALLLLLDIVQRRAWVRFKIPPISSLVWAGLAALSYLWIDVQESENKAAMKSWIVATLNPVFFAVVAVWVFQNIADDLREYRRLLLVLGASFGLCVLMALKQYFGSVGIPFDPANPTQDLGGTTDMRLGGWYDFRYMFGAHAAMIVPAATAFALIEKNSLIRWLAAAIAALTLCVTLAAGGFVAACAGVVAVGAFYAVSQRWLTGLTVIAALACLLIVVLPRLPRKNDAVITRGLALFAGEEEKKPTARLRRYQASMDLLSSPSKGEGSAPLWVKGVGAGRYQGQVNRFYQPPYNKPGRRTDDEAAYDMEADERFSFGQLETVTVELGIAGLLAVLFLYGTWIFSAQAAFSLLSPKDVEDDPKAVLALSAFGAGVGALVLSVFSNPLIRGVGGTFALFMAIAFVVYQSSRQKSASNTH
jgi:hypothetical protein